ncbi:hypothetical protein FNJ47_06185 [Bradyrhizobium sp. UFLA 03-164]|uniref:Uncharacterized protein n=1 Tax=Bradyrhizobium uaiense TaxID=2594946 RepID=A0A6P1BCY0_9BRAD|nr:hypothetical protein [Bradyrhizobium uaiense]
MIATVPIMAHCAPSPRLRGEGWGEGESPQGRQQFGRRRVTLTRNLRIAQIPTSPRKRGEVKHPARLVRTKSRGV